MRVALLDGLVVKIPCVTPLDDLVEGFLVLLP